MKIKVCGMREEQNMMAILKEPPDFIGLIFYEKSSRFVGELSTKVTEIIPNAVGKTGVFVNASLDFITEKTTIYKLDLIQLHGKETPAYCKELKTKLAPFVPKLIKVFNVNETFDFAEVMPYEKIVDYFLFDTHGKLPGGNGKTFNWELLENYKGQTPFFLSGGIGPEHIEIIKKLNIDKLFAVDVNSKFEIAPALKDQQRTNDFVAQLRQKPASFNN